MKTLKLSVITFALFALISFTATNAHAWCTPRIIQCGTVIDSTTLHGHDDINKYPSCTGNTKYNGKAHVYKYHSPGVDSLHIRLDWTGDANHAIGVFVLGSCNANDCIAFNSHSIELRTTHRDYWIIVDSRYDVSTAYRLTVTCGSDFRLPVELLSFTAESGTNGVQLNWNTASETDNQGYRIERQNQNEESWDLVGTIQGQGTTTAISTYSYTDARVTPGNTYAYRLISESIGGETEEISLITVTYAQQTVSAPAEFRLVGNYPNPFNPTTRIVFELAESGQIALDVFDVNGRLVENIAAGMYSAGMHGVDFQAANLPSGVYFARLNSSFGSQIMKMMLLK